MESGLYQLPSGDLWRGHRPDVTAAPTVTNDVKPAALDSAIAAVLKNRKPGDKELTCIWCGQQYAEPQMREHIATLHKHVLKVESPEDLMALAMAGAVPTSNVGHKA